LRDAATTPIRSAVSCFAVLRISFLMPSRRCEGSVLCQHARQTLILWPDNRICFGAEWALYVHLDFVLLRKFVGSAHDFQLLTAAHAGVGR